jgi:hypothetical protein
MMLFCRLALQQVSDGGWNAEMARLSSSLRQSCLEPVEGGEERKRENLEGCIRAIFSEDNDTSEDMEEKWKIYVKPILEDIVL